MTERRRFLRFDTALNALCEIVSDKNKRSSKVKNLSKEGALLLLDKQLAEGSPINLSLDVPGDNVPVFATCEVAWQKKYEPAKKEVLYETGVRFKKIGSADRGKLFEYIYLQWLKVLDQK
ncbi:MAG: PilZ domain-containing protein [Candidatus Omnitrophica bacterium]|nr:PilZ domain-containing protein [Candidatus Omnitrophota bacterium]